VLYFVVTRLIKVDTPKIDASNSVSNQLNELGSISTKEKRLIITSLLLLAFWSTEGILHPLDSTTVTVIAVAYMLIPGIGILPSWKVVQERVPWGTIIVFAVGISMGQVLLRTEGASWLSAQTFEAMGIAAMPLVAMIAVLALFNILI